MFRGSWLRGSRVALAALAVGLIVTLLGGCGVGDSSVQTFALDGIGPEGGVVQAGDVRLTLPPGALAQKTGVAILPESDPFPILKAAGDLCNYAYLGPIWCCGPVGLDLNVPATLRVTYDEALIPAAVLEVDLVLMLWDDVAQSLRPTTAGVVHDLAGNYFETATYGQLGHLAVGIRACPGLLQPIVLLGQPPAVPLVGPSGLFPGTPNSLYLATTDGSVPLEALPTEGDDLDLFVPSPDGSHVLYVVFRPDESRILRALALGATAPVTVVDDTRDLNGSDPLFGWRRGAGDVFFPEYLSGQATATAHLAPGFLEGSAVSTVAPDGAGTPAVLYGLGLDAYLDDLRQSGDGSKMLLRVQSFGKGFVEHIDVIDAATGELLSSGAIPVDFGLPTPRFIPGSTDVSAIALDRRSVERYAPDGTSLATLYALDPEDSSVILEFAVSPSGEGYAVILQEGSVNQKAGVAATIGGEDTLEVGLLDGSPTGAVSLGLTGGFYPEMIFHPNGQHVLVDDNQSVRLFAAADATPGSVLPVRSMADLDVHASDGRLLLLLRPILTDFVVEGGVPGSLVPGLYVAEPDGSGLTLVPTEGLALEAARWLTGLRATPGMFISSVR